MPLLSVLRRVSLVCLLALIAGSAAHAQTVSVYATAAPSYLNHLYTVSSTNAAQSSLSGQWFVGVNGGVTFNFATGGPFSVGLDFRGGPEIGTPGLGSALAGVKFGIKPPVTRLKPYFQLSTGFLEQRHTTGSGTFAVTNAESYVAFELIGGVDYPVAPHVDIRVIEAGVGLTHPVVTNGTDTVSAPNVLSLSSGIVFRF